MDKQQEDARISQEAARIRAQRKAAMQNRILQRMRQSGLGRAVGAAYDSPLAHAALSGARDFYRRFFENGWYQKDLFDGRWHMDNQIGQSSPGQSLQGMDRQYDHRASFYGWDKQAQNNGQDRNHGQEYSRER
jgi:hypothetical protein